MNKIFKTITIRTIKQNIKQFLMVIFIVFLGTTLLSGFVVNSNSLKKSIDSYFDNTNLADIWVYTDKINSEDIDFFDSLEDVTYDERLYIETTATFCEKGAQNSAKVFVSKGKISTPYICGSEEQGCFIDKNIASNYGLQTFFDSVDFDIPYEFFGEKLTIKLNFMITDTMTLCECANTYSSWPIFIDEKTFLKELNKKAKLKLEEKGIIYSQDIFEQVPYNQILLKTSNVDSTVEKINNYYYGESKVSDSNLIFVQTQDSQESVFLLNGEIEQATKMIYVFPVIFFVVCILVILTTINQLVLQEKQRIGTLKSIGVENKTIMFHYSFFGAILCAIGALIGVIFGILLIPNIMMIKYNLVYSLPYEYMNLYVPFWILILIFVGVVLLGFLVSFFACKNIVKKKPIDCLRFEINSTKFKKEKINSKKIPFAVKMGFRNIKLKPIRTIMTMIGIAGCFSLLLCGFGINDTLEYSLSNDLDKVFVYDVSSSYINEDFEQKLLQIDGIENYETYEKLFVEAKSGSMSENVSLFRISENSKLTTINLKNNEVFISKSISEDLDVSVGDELDVIYGNKVEKLKISKIGETSVTNGIFVCETNFDMSLASKNVWIKCNNPNVVCEKINQINGTNTAMTKQQTWDDVNNKISSIDLMTTTLKVFAILLAIVVLVGLVILILNERIRELATLKVLGQNIVTISLTILFEILFMSFFGIVIGSVLGYPLLVLVLSINKVSVVNYLYHINFSSFVLSFAIVFLTIMIVQILVFYKVKKVNMIESLKSVE